MGKGKGGSAPAAGANPNHAQPEVRNYSVHNFNEFFSIFPFKVMIS